MSSVIIAEINGSLEKLVPDLRESTATLSRIKRIHGCESGETGYAVKYVIDGTELYWVKEQKITVSAGQFLLLNHNQPCHYDIAGPHYANGLCIRLSPWYIDRAFQALTVPEKKLLDYPFDEPGYEVGFAEGVYLAEDFELGSYLQKVVRVTGPVMDSHEFFISLADYVLKTQSHITGQVKSISAKRNTTRKEIYERLSKAKLIMDETTDQPLDIAVIANQSAMSEFHFYRSFRESFGLSPYQYYLHRRLRRAVDLLQTTTGSITEIALTTGFADLPAFSRSFKNNFKVSPNEFRKQLAGKRNRW